MGRKEALKKFHQAAIANVADQLFQEKGVTKTTMDDIAQKADYSKATLYVYFNSKEDIFHYIILNAMHMLLGSITEAIHPADNALTQYNCICKRITNFSNQYPFYYQSLLQTIAIDEENRKKSPILDEIYQTGEQINTAIEQVLHAGVQQGHFREDANNVQTVFLFWAAISSVVQLANNKEAYLQQRMGLTKNEFLDFSFATLLRAIKK